MTILLTRGALFPILGLLPLASASAEGFIDDSKLKLQLRNVYFNENFRDEHGMSTRAARTAKSERTEWAQGFLLDYQSGFTPGTLGFGVDALGLLGVKLDSGRGRSGTGLLPVHDDGRAADEFASAGMTAKARIAKTTLKYGTLLPKTPVLVYNDARLLPQTYQGAQISSTDIDNLTVTGGYLERFKLRDSSDSMPIVPDGYGGDKSGDFSYAGADYKLGKNIRLSYFYGELENFYRQNFVGIQHDLPLGAGVLTSDLRYFNSVDSGSAYGGKIDNDMLSGLLSYAVVGHTLSAGYQTLSGEAGLPYVSGATVYSFSNVGIGKFIEEDEKTWMLGYGYDFARLGVPGLTFSTRYLSGNDGKSNTTVKEWERDAEIAYVVQQGTFKGLGVKLRNYVYRSDFSRGRDSNRIYFSYDIALW
ncbi:MULTISPECIES: OprD family porin [unclassified Pseudomonas]|uniref:OprD family porin n=1 Tax=unclassified Pseudomonas TaxID=196821 RepID=UPI00087144A4|nr:MULTISPECIES: OprD family porin [unclassified Pseudomonas]SCW33600.1 outer membrane porin, OprD family [Pseudomonas sp. NFACC05-1]SCZ20046.1 outer membrane porin, OprD family [Pseudomonas sp. NFACC44-2]SDA45097.1 outer membrane porin, OprD family [Pseudomonas sp. NFACC51]SFH06729.1 outer membrane porin, OprD family [Pseudomonas sp. NFACC54]SFS41016.1 outer membrane porin, OprD family [Pseudomonas sp. NFACC48-1]